MKVVLETLKKSVRKCEQLFINPSSDGSSSSLSSDCATGMTMEETTNHNMDSTLMQSSF